MTQWNPEQVKQATLSPRWAALSQTGGVAADLNNYDRFLIREPRLLVPIDVQALVVRTGANDTTPMLRLPFRTNDENFPPLDITDQGTARPAGVHLLWAVPAALGKGSIVDDPAAPNDPTRRRLDLPMLPDRWVVLRIAVPTGAHDPVVTGWVIEADTGTATPLTQWPQGTPATIASAIPAAQLNVHAGGLGWNQCYDSAVGRCSFFDDLSDLKGTTVEGDALSYLVAGWWSRSGDDPLDGVGSDLGYRQRLHDLGWNDPDHPSPDATQRDQGTENYRVAKAFGLPLSERYTQSIELAGGKAPVQSSTNPYVASGARVMRPAISGFLSEAVSAGVLPPAPSRSTLVHGRIHGVPLSGAPVPDSEPNPAALRVVLGSSTPDVAAAVTVAGAGMGTSDQNARRDAERLIAAFTSGLLIKIADANTWADLDEYEHQHGFKSLPGGIESTDRFVDKPGTVADPGAGFRPGGAPGGQSVKKAGGAQQATVLWSASARPDIVQASAKEVSIRTIDQFDGRVHTVPPTPPATVRDVPRPAPPYWQPSSPMLAVTGGGRALSAVETEEADGKLMCRLSDQTSKGHTGVLGSDGTADHAGHVGGTGRGARPRPRGALGRPVPHRLADPARAGQRSQPESRQCPLPRRGRGGARLLLRRQRAHRLVRVRARVVVGRTAEGDRGPVAALAVGRGVGPPRGRHDVGPAVASDVLRLAGQHRPRSDRRVRADHDRPRPLGQLRRSSPRGQITLQGRSALVPGVAKTVASGIDRWLTEERQRDIGGHGLADPQTEASLASLRDTLAQVDMLSVALDGVREQLLGMEYDRGLVYLDENALPTARASRWSMALPQLLAAGRLKLTTARLVDAFGRHVDLPVDQLIVPQRLVEPDTRDLLVRPRITAPARWRFDLVDATSTSADAALARIDQADLTKQVNPVAGFLLPDHMDDSLEVFATDGTPLGELLHDAYSDAVTWEIAPGRTDVAPAAGPTDDPDPARQLVGWIAAGVVASDAADRKGTPDRGETESSLSALLRAIDTTLWTVDPFGSLGTEHIAGLVGRPIAVVAARLSLDVKSDLDDHVLHRRHLRTGRQAAFDAMAAQVFEVRLGEITRSDDGLLGYFVDDDYSTFHVVDRVIAERALPSGRGQGVLDPTNTDPLAPVPITHPYINTDGVLRIRPGQTMRLTLLMHPGGKVHISAAASCRAPTRRLRADWVNPGLSVLAPSLRSGPLLIDADKVRLPKVASFPAEQLFTHRDTPTSWKDDPILAATQSALLPDTQPEVQEGWIRIAPNQPDASGGGA